MKRAAFYFCFAWVVCGGAGMRDGRLKKAKQGLSFERTLLCPAGTWLFFLCCFGRLRGGRQNEVVQLWLQREESRLVL